MKKIVKFVLVLVILFVLCSAGIWVWISFFLDENFIARQIESRINARVELQEIHLGLFSLSPSLTCKGIAIAKRDDFANAGTPLNERAKIKSPPVALQKFEFNVNLMPLLKKQFELRSFLASNAKLRIELKANGKNNLAPLFGPPAIVNGKANPAFAQKKDTARPQEKTPQKQAPPASPPETGQKPFSVFDLPIAAKLNRIGLERAQIDVLAQKTGQHFQISGLNMIIDGIDIDPRDLPGHNRATVRFDMQFSAFGQDNSEQMKMTLFSSGDIQPFEVKTGYVNPVITYRVQLKKGSFISSLIGLEQVEKKLSALNKVGMNLENLTKRAELKEDTETSLRYNNGRIAFIEDLNFPTQDYDLLISKDGWVHIFNNTHHFSGNVLFSKTESEKMLADVDRQIAKQASAAGKQNIQIDPQKIRDHLLEGLLKDGRISIDFESKGDIKSPDVKLSVIPPSIGSVLKATFKDTLKDNLLKKADQIELPQNLSKEQKEKTQDVLKGIFK